jgi:hypothetical protein
MAYPSKPVAFHRGSSYQGIINPALDPSNDYGSAFSFRLRSSW